MRVEEITHSLINPNVAWAAIVSIGGDFALLVNRRASLRGTSIGDYTAQLIGTFKSTATAKDLAEIEAIMRLSEHPLLVGLRRIVELDEQLNSKIPQTAH